MLRPATLVFAFLLLVSAAWAQPTPPRAAKNQGLSENRLTRIRAVTEEHIAAGRMAGVVTVIARNGKVPYFKAFGMADMENKVPMAKDTIFRIYSMSKPITSVATMVLFEEGHFLLTDPVEKYLPELANRDYVEIADGAEKLVDAKRSITIQDLLRHTSGYTYGLGGDAYDKRYADAGILLKDKNLAETIDKLEEIPLKHSPGDEWTYGVNTDILARLVEVVSGQTFDEFLQERIFDRLKMSDTGFVVPEEKRSRLAQLYTRGDDGKLFANPDITRSYQGVEGYFSGGAGLYSTAGDYLRFCRMLLNGGALDGQRILSPKSVELMSSDALDDIPADFPWSDGAGFGLGFQVTTDLGATGMLGSVGEYGWGGAAGTRFWIDPKEKMITLYMIQILPHTGLQFSSQFKNLAYQAIEKSNVN